MITKIKDIEDMNKFSGTVYEVWFNDFRFIVTPYSKDGENYQWFFAFLPFQEKIGVLREDDVIYLFNYFSLSFELDKLYFFIDMLEYEITPDFGVSPTGSRRKSLKDKLRYRITKRKRIEQTLLEYKETVAKIFSKIGFDING